MRIYDSGRNIPVRQTEETAYQAGQDKNTSGTAASVDPTAPEDVFISSENSKWIEEALNQQQDAKTQMDEMSRLLESANAQADAENESAEVRRKCLTIASRIMAGDEVPQKDHRYLAKHDLGLYCRALCMRVVKEKAKRHKAISDDESTENHSDSAVDTGRNKDIQPPDTGESLDSPEADAPSGQTASG